MEWNISDFLSICIYWFLLKYLRNNKIDLNEFNDLSLVTHFSLFPSFASRFYLRLIDSVNVWGWMLCDNFTWNGKLNNFSLPTAHWQWVGWFFSSSNLLKCSVLLCITIKQCDWIWTEKLIKKKKNENLQIYKRKWHFTVVFSLWFYFHKKWNLMI